MLKAIDFIFDNNIEYKKPSILLVLGTAHSVDYFSEKIVKYNQIYNYKKIIISGYNGEAENIALNLRKRGVSPSKLILESEAKNTLENIIFSTPLLENYKDEEWHVMGKLYALPRIKLTVLKHCNNDKVSFIPVDLHNVNKDNWIENKKFVEKIANEFNKIRIYQKKGDISDFEKFFDLTSYNTFMNYVKNIEQRSSAYSN
ncbi:YdcF family protein [Psychrobacter lutiphocae]|uniref:YdcF family protein n=1 Tax=Psychrobacter lutiphocae TaxID=540500 RepID=UPI000379FD9E|nr:YdcF family protein [Psychrobacter lutiphocae]